MKIEFRQNEKYSKSITMNHARSSHNKNKKIEKKIEKNAKTQNLPYLSIQIFIQIYVEY